MIEADVAEILANDLRGSACATPGAGHGRVRHAAFVRAHTLLGLNDAGADVGVRSGHRKGKARQVLGPS
ncbi:MAG: hypothetical protein R2742_15650 [Micropruina glycogenica]